MKIIKLNENQIRRVIALAKPSKNDFYSYQNLKIKSGLQNENGDILTMTYYLSDTISQCGNDESYYALLTDHGDAQIYMNTAHGKTTWIGNPFPEYYTDEELERLIEEYGHRIFERLDVEKKSRIDILNYI